MVRRLLRQRLRHGGKSAPVVLQDDLIIVIGAREVAVDAVADHQHGRGIRRGAEHGAERRAVNPAATVTVILSVHALAVVILHHVGQPHGGHDAVLFRVHRGAGDFVHVKNRHIERVLRGRAFFAEGFENALTDCVVFKFQ